MADKPDSFAKLFDTPDGQLLAFLDETDEGDPSIHVIAADVSGVRAAAKLSGWPDGEEGQLRNFAKIDQAAANEFAVRLRATAASLAPKAA